MRRRGGGREWYGRTVPEQGGCRAEEQGRARTGHERVAAENKMGTGADTHYGVTCGGVGGVAGPGGSKFYDTWFTQCI
jgi:hypothetical protein